MAIVPNQYLRMVEQQESVATADPLAALADAAVAGDQDALRTVIVSVGPAVLRVVRGMLGSAHPDVEDVAQDAVIGFSRALHSFRHQCTVTHFACRIAVLTALTARRNARVRSRIDFHEIDADMAGTDSPSPSSLACAMRQREALRALCESLPEAQSEALAMMCILGFTVEEIATATGVPANTVASRLRLAKGTLRAKVEADPRLLDALEYDE